MQDTNITDDAVNKFFASGGQDSAELPQIQEITKENVSEQTEQHNAEIDVAQHGPEKNAVSEEERNYKAAMFEERERRREEQERRKDLENKLRETEYKTQQLETRMQQMLEHMQQKPQAPAPNFDEAPLEALKYEQDVLKKQIEYQNYIEQQRQEQFVTQQREQAFVSQYSTDASEFEKQTPDFKEAYTTLMNSRFEELRIAGFNPQEAKALLIEDEKLFVRKAYEDKVNPAQRLYELAKSRGYAPKATQQSNNSMQQMAKAKDASVSLSNASGGQSQSNKLTVEAVLAMDDDEFAANWGKWQ